MKSRKTFLTIGIIALVLFLGVGYAVVSSVYIKTGGTANVGESELNVEITNAVATTNITNKTVDFNHTLSNKNLTSMFTLNGMELNEEVVITYTITNNEKDVDATIYDSDIEITNSNSEYYIVKYFVADSYTDLKNNDKTMEVDVIVQLIKTPVAEEGSTTTIELTALASPFRSGKESPIKFGERYIVTMLWGADYTENRCWFIFYRDGTIDQKDDCANLSETEGYIYLGNKIYNSGIGHGLYFNVSSDGKTITQTDGSQTFATLTLESEL